MIVKFYTCDCYNLLFIYRKVVISFSLLSLRLRFISEIPQHKLPYEYTTPFFRNCKMFIKLVVELECKRKTTQNSEFKG